MKNAFLFLFIYSVFVIITNGKSQYGENDNVTSNTVEYNIAKLDSIKIEITNLNKKFNYSFEDNNQYKNSIDSLISDLYLLYRKIDNKLLLLDTKISSMNSSDFEYINYSSSDENKKNIFPKLLSDNDYIKKYNESLNNYRNRDFDISVSGFKQLIYDNPNNMLADNSQYWLAECFYSKMEFHRAIYEFKKVYNFSESEKLDDAQLKIGMSYIALDRQKDAREQFYLLLDKFPESEFTVIAQEQLKLLPRD